MKKTQIIPIVLCGLLALVIGLIVAKTQQSSQGHENLQLVSGTALNPGKPIKPFDLLDHHGEKFDLERLQGKWTILFFGFTNCPDICPVTMQFLKSVKNNLIEQNAWENMQVGFFTVDPARDTVKQLSNYVPHFDPEFIGITGTIEAVEKFAKQMSMPFELEEKNERGYYNVAHSASLLLISPDAQLRGIISAPHQLQPIVTDVASLTK